jgi:amino acid transporter
MTWICLLGIEVSARAQWFLLGAELVTLGAYAAAALVQVYTAPPSGAHTPSLAWIDPLAVPSAEAFAEGLLLALFIYWGWDTTLSVNEESRDSARAPGRAAIASTLVLVVTYVLVAVSAQAYHGTAFLERHSEDVLSASGAVVLGFPLDRILIVAVLTSAAASTLTTILPTTRTALAMAVNGALPRYFGRIHPRYLTPGPATLWIGVLAVTWYAGLTTLSRNVLHDSLLALGLMIAFYYGLTGFACSIYYRRELTRSARNLVQLGVAPAFGGIVLGWAFVKSCVDLADPANSASGDAWFGVGPPLVIGLSFLALVAALMLLQQMAAPAFFRRPAETAPATSRIEEPAGMMME